MPGDEAGLGKRVTEKDTRIAEGDEDLLARHRMAVNRMYEETTEIFPTGKLPLSARQILAKGLEYGWAFGPISLVVRMNHPAPDVEPFYVSWLYDPTVNKWKPEGGRTRSGQPLGVKEILAMLPEVIDPDCRDGKHSACIGEPCACECHYEVEDQAA